MIKDDASTLVKFSIVTISRNNRDGLRKTLESLVAQRYRSFESIVIDGASTDGSQALVEALLPLLPITMVSESDTGIFNAMNKGLNLARGQYVLFLNSGDILFDPKTLECVAAETAERLPSYIYGDSVQVSALGLSAVKRARTPAAITFGMFACHQAIYYRREIIGSLRFRENLKCAGDYAFTAEFLSRASGGVYLQMPLCIFDTSGVSSTNEGLGRRENWAVQRDVMNLSPMHRAVNRARYWMSAILRKHASSVYVYLRFR